MLERQGTAKQVLPMPCERRTGMKKTFQEWKDQGYHVVKGEKSVSRNEAGVSLFSRNQVEKDRPIPIEMQIEMLCISEADLY